MKKFYLPGYYVLFDMFTILDIYQRAKPEYFIEDRIIAGAYDLPTGLKWNGGRGGPNNYSNIPYQPAQISLMTQYYWNKSNFILLHTCTNLFINTQELLTDKDCNNFISTYYRPQDKIIIANQILKQYLSERYSNISFINSTTLGIINIDEVNELSKKETYVIYYGKNNDNDYLMKLKYKDNIEILCAEPCVPNCPNRRHHYEIISKAQLGETIAKNELIHACPYIFNDKKNIPAMIEAESYRVNNKRIEELNQMGFSNFKLSGRNYNANAWIQLIIYYLVKPQYWNIVYNDLNTMIIQMKK